MGSLRAQLIEHAGGQGGCSGKLVPPGRVIRSVGQLSAAVTPQPANCDRINRMPKGINQSRLLSIACIGLISGIVLSTLAPSIHVLTTDATSRDIFTAMKDDLNTWDVAATERPASAKANRHARSGERLSKDDRDLARILSTTKLAPLTQKVRLAAYQVEPSTEVRIAAPQNAPFVEAPYQVRDPSLPSRTLVGRVHSVIKKYSPKHKNAAQLAHAIVQEGLRQGVDPLFVAAVIKSESAFNTFARSHKGAQGLMQIMPATGAWIVARHDLPKGKLTDPGHNLRLGVSYLKYLDETYRGNRIFTLVAYNWGPGHVDSASGGRRRIPKECMKYALKIMQDYRRWSSGVI